MTHPDPHALILRMADELDHARQLYLDDRTVKCPLATEARALLAAPQQGPTLDDISELCDEFNFPLEDEDGDSLVRGIRLWGMANSLITRYSAQAAPVAVAKRSPGDDAYHPAGDWCWGWYSYRWRMMDRSCFCIGGEATHWLPHWALPLPEAQP